MSKDFFPELSVFNCHFSFLKFGLKYSIESCDSSGNNIVIRPSQVPCCFTVKSNYAVFHPMTSGENVIDALWRWLAASCMKM